MKERRGRDKTSKKGRSCQAWIQRCWVGGFRGGKKRSSRNRKKKGDTFEKTGEITDTSKIRG